LPSQQKAFQQVAYRAGLPDSARPIINTVGERAQHIGAVRIGISGWSYKSRRGVFYPEGLPQKKEPWLASRAFPTIEINGSFYSLQLPQSYAEWLDATPDDLVFAVKGSRFIRKAPRDVFVYFDNDAKVRAPFDAQGLIHRVCHALRKSRDAAEPVE
jgi:uncharacterized protein YecE (DUF72 family)